MALFMVLSFVRSALRFLVAVLVDTEQETFPSLHAKHLHLISGNHFRLHDTHIHTAGPSPRTGTKHSPFLAAMQSLVCGHSTLNKPVGLTSLLEHRNLLAPAVSGHKPCHRALKRLDIGRAGCKGLLCIKSSPDFLVLSANPPSDFPALTTTRSTSSSTNLLWSTAL